MSKTHGMDGKVSLEVVLQNQNERKKAPSCKHGPALLFQKGDNKFFTCSAIRQQSVCPFNVSYKDWNHENKIKKINSKESFGKTDAYFDLDKFKALEESDRSYCHKCGLLFQQSVDGRRHSSHQTQSNITLHQLNNPSTILTPLESNKCEAQYLFTENTINTIVKILQDNRFSNIICIGSPTIHEKIQNLKSDDISSVLLDLDKRRYSFHKPEDFHCYNMFNNHFFNDGEFEYFKKKLSKGKPCLIIDPPFGGRIEPLGQTINEISSLYKDLTNTKLETILPSIIVLPYFMEPQINNHIPGLQMSDFQVEYKNHNSFKNSKDKKGSPVRLFTNIPLHNISLAHDKQYKYCSLCDKWVGNWNTHCPSCNNCTGKNGTSYKHCKVCNRCVKTSWSHCESCHRCCLQSHSCNTSIPAQKCFLCKNYGHKKNFCPSKNAIPDDIKTKDKLIKAVIIEKKVNKKSERRKRSRLRLQLNKQ